MRDTLLPWEKIGWEEFQRLTIHFAQDQIKGLHFEEFLKQGNNQEGIDVISVRLTDGKNVTIQCKHKNLNKSDIGNIVKDFRTGSFFGDCAKFILATTSDLQKEAIQKEIANQKKNLDKKGIIFEVWDNSFLSEQLRRQKTLIEYYFGKQTANEHCFDFYSPESWQENEPVDNFIGRRVSIFEPEIEYNSYQERFYFQKDNYYLAGLFSESRLSPNHICLIADAHLGKSVSLKQLAFDLEHIEQPYKCLFIELKLQANVSIENILNNEYKGWQSIPNRDIVIFLDGLDEVEATSFRFFAKNINAFQKANSQINIVFSCRKLFYMHFNIEEITTNFIAYELLPIDYSDVHEYLNKQLGDKKISFERKVNNADINNLLFHPFYLTFLVKKYNENPANIPNSKLEIIKLFVKESYSISSKRETSSGSILSHEEYYFNNVVQKFAFALQLTGLNAIENIDLQKLFPKEDIQLLHHSSLIGYQNNKWSFDNAIFQEHLAAFVLEAMEVSEILSTISIGKQLKKIKAKWIQTVASLLSFLDKSSDKYQRVLKFLLDDNIELIFTTEESKFDDVEKNNFLNILFSRCKKYTMRPQIIDARTIASFIANSNKCKDIVIKQIKDKRISLRIKSTCINILEIIDLNFQQKTDLYSACKKNINETDDSYYIRQVLETLALHKIGDKSFIDKLISNTVQNDYHEYRQGVYKLISSLGFIEHYYDYALHGIKYLMEKNKGITQTGSEFNLEEVLFATKSYDNVVSLLKIMNDKDWLEYYKQTYRKSKFIRKLAETAVTIHSKNPLILLHIISFIKGLGRNYTRKDYQEINLFFERTDTNTISFKILGKDFFIEHYWQYGDLITKDCIEYALQEYDAERITQDELSYIFYSIPNKNSALRETFLEVYNSITGIDFFDKSQATNEYEQQEFLRLKNDIKYLKSKRAFINGVKSFFDAYGKSSIPEDDIHIDIGDKRVRMRKDSYLVSMFLSNWVKKTAGKVSLKNCLEALNKKGLFEFYRIEKILNNPYKQEEFASLSKKIAEKYFYQNLPKCNFENCIWETLSNDKELKTRYRTLEVQMGRLFKRYEFSIDTNSLMEFIWLDDGGIRNFEKDNDSYSDKNHKESIAEIILRNLSQNQVSIFKRTIIAHLHTGIQFESVLGTHISICRHLQITESLDYILKLIYASNTRSYYRSRYIEIYLELGGDYCQLIPILKAEKDFNNYSFRTLIDKLYQTKDKNVVQAMLRCLRSASANEDIKIVCARYLCFNGKNVGFDYLLEVMEKTKKAPFTIQGNVPISNIDTKYALEKLDEHAILLLTNDNNSRFFESRKQILLEWLYSLGRKSEHDTDLVYKYFLKHERSLRKQITNSYDLFWYAFNVIENYREQNTNNKTIDETIKILHVM